MVNATQSLEQALTAIRDRAAHMEAEAKAERLEAERALKLARGTSDVHEKAANAVRIARVTPARTKAPTVAPRKRATIAPRVEPSLAEKVEAILRGPFAPLDLRAIASAANEPATRVLALLKKLRSTPAANRAPDTDAKQVYNLGTEDEPRWIWAVGDDTSADELYETIRKLISIRPMTFAEIKAATGARGNRISGRLVRLQRALPVFNVGGDEQTFRWYLAPKRKVA